MKLTENNKFFLKLNSIFFIILQASLEINAASVNSWECSKFEGSKIIGDKNIYLGKLGPPWLADSIFNSSSTYSSTWSQNSIFNSSSIFGSNFSQYSAFNDHASNPPKIVSDIDGFLGFLSTGMDWTNSHYHPLDFKFTCDWD